MGPILNIRKRVLGMSQAELAVIAGVSQGTVSKWETGELAPDRDQLARIRQEIIDRGIDWDDSWFFEVPAMAPGEASQGAA